MSSIQQIFYPADDFGPGERDYLSELRSWLETQPQDAWLLFALDMNRDGMDPLLPMFVDRPDCDIAVIAAIFWYSDPAYWIGQTPDAVRGTLIDRILENHRQGFYRYAELSLPQPRIQPFIDSYLAKRRQLEGGGLPFGLGGRVFGRRSRQLPFDVPDALFGPFRGRELRAKTDPSTAAHLKEIHQELGCHYDRYWFE